jgi:hypothetical protein
MVDGQQRVGGGRGHKVTGRPRGRPAKGARKKPRQAAGGNRGTEGVSLGLSYGNGVVGPGANTGPWIEVDANGKPIPNAPVHPAASPTPVIARYGVLAAVSTLGFPPDASIIFGIIPGIFGYEHNSRSEAHSGTKPSEFP